MSVRQDDEAAREYIIERLKVHIARPYIGLMVGDDAEIAGAVILNDYRPGQNIELTAHVCGAWKMGDVRGIARYCFDRVRRITAKTRYDNERAIRMLRTLGFRSEGVAREWFGDADAIVFCLLKSEQRIFH
jgi:RimJ/RimL family protein N-acetyltransferase